MPLPTGDALSTRLVGWRLLLPDNRWIVQVLAGILDDLTFSDTWQQSGAVTPDQAANAFQDIVDSLMPYPNLIGMIMAWTHPLTTYPDGVLPCDGASYLRTEYPDLYEIIGLTYSPVGEPADQFCVPDLRGRSVLGAGTGPGLTPRTMADPLGDETVTLGVDQLPAHNHSDSGHIHSVHSHLPGLAVSPGELPIDVPNALPESTSTGNAAISNTGGGQPFDIIPPVLVLRWVIVCGVHIA
jgi:microcystin-dependent protein